jgi:DNA-binding MarR family transcriptional regulator
MCYLVAVADAGSLTKAADLLGVAQPTLTQGLNKLEAELGVRLFERSRRGAALTDTGRAIIDDVRASLALADSATMRAKAIAGGKAGRLHIGFVTHAVYEVLPSALRLLRNEYPSVEVRKSASEIYSVLGVGQWIGTSGAAFSTGIGRETTLGMSLLMGIANVRLGIWWGSGYGTRTTPSGLRWVTAGIGAVFRTQTYLSYEFRARFFGMHRHRSPRRYQRRQ